MPAPLDRILKPRSIAVIGASRSPNSIGHQILANLIRYGFTGPVYPVNPKAASIHSVKAYPTIDALPEPPDLAVIVVPQPHVLAVAEACGRSGVGGLVVISAGFREVGREGAEAERQLVEIVRQSGMRMVGPNCMGVLNADPALSMNATFAPSMPPFGPVAFVSQSGALGLNVLDYASEYGLGIAQFVSVGNKPDVSGNDLLLQWEQDPAVGVILMYVENFGNPRRFLEIAGRITKTKPIIAVKSGRSTAGARAASSHTGALAASDAAVDALLAQAGVLRAGSIEELFDMAIAFRGRALPRSRRAAVITNSGGPGILVADALAVHGLELVDLHANTVAQLTPLFPREASIRNPLDMIASATPQHYHAALHAVLADPGVDAAVAIFVPPLGIRQEDVAEAIVATTSEHPEKPVLTVLMGREGLPQGRAELFKAGIPAFIFPESAARALAALCRQQEWQARPQEPPPRLQLDLDRVKQLIGRLRSEQRRRFSDVEMVELLSACGIRAAAAQIARTPDAAVRIATEIGFPVVLKVMSPQVIHKTDIGGVRVDIDSAEELRQAYDELVAAVTQAVPNAELTGILVQQMVRGGRETIVGFARDATFGPLVMFGLGGILVEALHDVVFRVAPIAALDARDMLRGIRGAALLGGLRGAPPVDHGALVDVLLRVGQLADQCPELLELDINPLLAFPDGAIAVDARATISEATAG